VVTDLEGSVLTVAGSGAIGKADGDFATASFHHPQGMTLDGELLYVADTKNHLIRRLDLAAHTVTTVAGTGEQARVRNVSGHGTQIALNSPWALERIGTQLFIAMAGPHQVWVLNLETGDLEPYAGSGREGITDGPRRVGRMAQPSGLTSDGTHLFVADSESSAIRALSLGPNGGLWTIMGQGLFEFGDEDGSDKDEVRLQHPLGIVYHDGVLYVADTYNHKIKKIDPTKATATTYLGNGKPGHKDGKDAEFYEPSGLSVAGGKLYIADTNNHAIRVADLTTAEVTTLRVRGLSIPTAIVGFREARFRLEEIINVAPQPVKAGEAGRVTLELALPAGYHLNPRAPLTYRVEVRGEGISVAEEDRRFHRVAPRLPLTIPFQASAGQHQAALDIDLTFYYCREDNTGVCAIHSARWNVLLRTVDDGTAVEPVVSYTAEPPMVQKKL
jgi:sugar lactone lactonase YvrE